MLRVAEVARRLDVSVATVYSLLAVGRLKCHRIGTGRGVIRVSEGHLAEYLEGAEPVAKVAPAPARRVTLRHLQRP